MSNATETCPDPARPVVEVTVRVKYPDGSERVPPDHSAQRLLLFLVLHGGTAHCEDVIRALWPDVDLSTGRRRLRITTAGLNDARGAIITRSLHLAAMNANMSIGQRQANPQGRVDSASQAGSRDAP